MPISQILPDGRVRIFNSTTGQTADVKPEELGKYNPKLVGQYQTAVAQRDAVQSGQMTVDQVPQSDRTLVSTGLSAAGYTPQDKAKKEAKGDTLKKAQALMDVIQKGKGGQLKGKEYEDALASLASQYTASKAFGEGGKSLTNSELSILSGQLPVIEKRTGTPVDKAFAWMQGREVPQRGVVVDDPKTLERKMLLAISALKGEKADPNALNAVNSVPAGKSVEQFAGNAGNDTKNILNSILGIPGQVANTVKTAATAQDPRQRQEAAKSMQLNEILGNLGKGYISSLNEDAGRPLEGGDIIGRAGENIYNRPVGTALDALPFLGAGAGKLKGGAGVKVAPNDGAPTSATTPNPLQKMLRVGADNLNGAGSKQYIARTTGKETAVPQNQVLMDEGILLHPTETGRIKATQGALNKNGAQIGDAYKGSDRIFKGSELDDLIDNKLKGQGYDAKSVDYIKKYINEQGGFDMSSGDNLITMEKAWGAAKNLEQNPPKMLKNPESASGYKKLSKDAARVIREGLGAKVPETKALNAKYTALRDYMDNILPETTEGVQVNSINSAIGLPMQAVKNTTNVANNVLYKALGVSPRKLLRDKRTGTENLRFRGT